MHDTEKMAAFQLAGSQDFRQEIYEEQLKYYEEHVPMTIPERSALREWVLSGHSPYDNPGSRYLPGRGDDQSFLSMHRQEKELEAAKESMTKHEFREFLEDYVCYDHVNHLEREMSPAHMKMKIRKLNRKVFHLLGFMASEGYSWDEALEYMNDHMDEEIPFELC